MNSVGDAYPKELLAHFECMSSVGGAHPTNLTSARTTSSPLVILSSCVHNGRGNPSLSLGGLYNAIPKRLRTALIPGLHTPKRHKVGS